MILLLATLVCLESMFILCLLLKIRRNTLIIRFYRALLSPAEPDLPRFESPHGLLFVSKNPLQIH